MNKLKYPGSYFVYTHSLYGDVFYVGSGKLKYYKRGVFNTVHERAFARSLRSDHWKEFVGEKEIDIQIVGYYKNKKESFEAEYKLINRYYREGAALVNFIGTMPVYQFALTGEFIKEWVSAKVAAIELKINPHSISCVLNNLNPKRYTVGSFLWSTSITPPDYASDKKVLIRKDLQGNIINIFQDRMDAVRFLKIRSDTAIRNAISGKQHKAYNSTWEYMPFIEAKEKGLVTFLTPKYQKAS